MDERVGEIHPHVGNGEMLRPAHAQGELERPAERRLRLGVPAELDQQGAVGDSQVDQGSRRSTLAASDRSRELALHGQRLLGLAEARRH